MHLEENRERPFCDSIAESLKNLKGILGVSLERLVFVVIVEESTRKEGYIVPEALMDFLPEKAGPSGPAGG